MNKLCVICLFFACLSNNGKSASKERGYDIAGFYALLCQEETPSLKDEADYFGNWECDSMRSILLAKKQFNKSATPIWDFLRMHKDLFLTTNLVDATKPINLVSNRFVLSAMDSGKVKMDAILVMFPEKRITKSGYTGQRLVVFPLAKDGGLDIAATTIAGDSNILLSKAQESR